MVAKSHAQYRHTAERRNFATEPEGDSKGGTAAAQGLRSLSKGNRRAQTRSADATATNHFAGEADPKAGWPWGRERFRSAVALRCKRSSVSAHPPRPVRARPCSPDGSERPVDLQLGTEEDHSAQRAIGHTCRYTLPRKARGSRTPRSDRQPAKEEGWPKSPLTPTARVTTEKQK